MYKNPLLLYLLALPLLIFGATSYCSDNKVENRIKAAFLYKFCDYISWPENVFSTNNVPITIGVVGGDDLIEDVKLTVKGKSVNGHPFDVKKVELGDSLLNINVLYFGKGATVTVEDFITPDNSRPILTVIDNDDSSPLGIIKLTIVDQRVRFLISNKRAREIGLTVNAQLLAIALQVDGGLTQ